VQSSAAQNARQTPRPQVYLYGIIVDFIWIRDTKSMQCCTPYRVVQGDQVWGAMEDEWMRLMPVLLPSKFRVLQRAFLYIGNVENVRRVPTSRGAPIHPWTAGAP